MSGSGCLLALLAGVVFWSGLIAFGLWHTTSGWDFWLPVGWGVAALGCLGGLALLKESRQLERWGPLLMILGIVAVLAAPYTFIRSACGVVGQRDASHPESHWDR